MAIDSPQHPSTYKCLLCIPLTYYKSGHENLKDVGHFYKQH